MTQIIINETTPIIVEVSTPGPQGSSGTIDVGTVTTGASGSAAAVTNSGTPSAAVFNFTIPKGDVGDVTPAATASKNAAEAAATAAQASSTAAQSSSTSASASATAALNSANQASASASTASTKAQEATTSANNASNSAQSVLAAANTATTKAQEAATSASNALASANTASTKAQEASASEVISTTKAQEAVVSASTATNAATSASASAASALASKQVTTDNAALAIAQANIASTKATQAAASEAEALVQAGVATAQANISTAQAVIATAQADISTTQAAAALASAQASATSASTSSTQAGISTTQATAASSSASNAALSAVAAAASQVLAAGSATAANTSAGNASGSAASALAIYGSAAAQQAALINAQAAASVAQGFAASAASVAQQDLSGVNSAALHRSPNAVTAMFLYDTSKDSDGGAWTEKCQHTSWYNEALTGKWLGAQTSEFQARNAGATVSATELITNGSFDTSTGWVLSADATIVGGKLNIASTSVSRAQTSPGLTIGKTYRVTLEISNVVGVRNYTVDNAGTGSGVDQYINEAAAVNGVVTAYFTPTRSGDFRVIGGTWTGNFSVDNISVREVTALNTTSNDYFQLTTDGKFYRLWKNFLSYSNDLENSVWLKEQGATISANAAAGYDGVVSADKLVEGTVTNRPRLRTQNIPGITTGSTYTLSFYAKPDGRNFLEISLLNGTITTFVDLSTGTRVSGSPNVSLVAVGSSGWYRVSVWGTHTQASGTYRSDVFVANSSANTSYTGDGVSGVLFRDFQFEINATATGGATAYEAKTTDGPTSEVFRGNKRKFPKLAGIVAEASSVSIYDLTEPGRPMWMRFEQSAGANIVLEGSSATSVSALQSEMLVGCSAYDLYRVRFANDDGIQYSNSSTISGKYKGNIAKRNAALSHFTDTTPNIVSRAINAVAMTVLPDAPVDPVTGLKVPTIAVATAGGVSVIKHNGTVVTSADTGARAMVTLTPTFLSTFGVNSTTWLFAGNPGALNAGFAFGSRGYNVPPDFAYSGTYGLVQTKRNEMVRRANAPEVSKLLNNESNITRGIASRVTNTSNTGHLVGDIRRAYLADVDVGSVSTGSENLMRYSDAMSFANGYLVVNGGSTVSFTDVDNTGENKAWTVNFAGIYPNTEAASFGGVPTSGFYTFSGWMKLVSGSGSLSLEKNGGGGAGLATLNPTADWSYFAKTFYLNAGDYIFHAITSRTGSKVVSFAKFQMERGVYATAYTPTMGSSISTKGFVFDRSYKAREASISGSLVKSQVASAAQLVAYSGFSGANYLREPYSADLDFGTGEWSVGAWVNTAFGNPNVNLVANPEDFSQHNAYGVTLTLNSTGTLDPVGGNNADLAIAGTANNNQSKTLLSGNQLAVQGVPNTMAIRVKSAGVRYVSFSHDIASNTSFVSYFDLDAVTVTQEGSGNTSSIVDIGNGWRLITLTAYPYATSTGARWAIAMQPQGTGSAYGSNAWVGDGVSGIYVYGVQKNPGTTLATYFPGQTAVYNPVFGARIASRSFSSGAAIDLSIDGLGRLTATAFDGTTTRTVTTTAVYNTATWLKAEAQYKTDGSLGTVVNGQEVAVTRGTPLLTLNNSNAVLTIGNSFAADAPFPGSIALLKASATVPTAEQSVWMYEQEKHMFRDGAQVTLPDANSIVDLTYDDLTDKWMAVSATNESEWSGLVRTSVTASPAGSYSKVTAASGIQLQARTTTNPGVDITIPAANLREELLKDAEAANKLNAQLAIFDYVGGFTANTTSGTTSIASAAGITYPVSYIGARVTGTGIPTDTFILGINGTTLYLSKAATATGTAVQLSFTDFILPVGYEAKVVLSAGLVKTEGTTKDYVRLFDGFKETIRFGTAPGYNTAVQIQATRSIQ